MVTYTCRKSSNYATFRTSVIKSIIKSIIKSVIKQSIKKKSAKRFKFLVSPIVYLQSNSYCSFR